MHAAPRWILRLLPVAAVVVIGGLVVIAWLGRARAGSGRVPCGSNLRQIGQACRQYAIDHGGPYPADLETVYRHSAPLGLDPEVFVCPEDTGVAPAPPPFVLGVNCSYGYLGKGLTDSAPSTVPLGHCYPAHHDNEGTHVLFADGSVRFFQLYELRELLPGLVAPEE